MTCHERFSYRPIRVDDRTLGLLSAAEAELVRADAAIAASPMKAALRQHLLRVEALSSVRVDGHKVDYGELLRLQVAVSNALLFDDASEYLFPLAGKLGLGDAQGATAAYRYLRAVDWVSQAVRKGAPITPESFEKIRALYNEDEIEKLAQGLGGAPLTPEGLKGVEVPVATGASAASMADDEGVVAYLQMVNSDILCPSAQAEVSHALIQMMQLYQGNLDGYERVFTHIIFYRRGMLTESIAPLAAAPAADVPRHVESLVASMAHLSQSDSRPEGEYCETIESSFRHSAYCTVVAARIMEVCRKELEACWRRYRAQLGLGRNQTAVKQLTLAFLEAGCLTVDQASHMIGKSFSATNNAMQTLVERKVVQEAGRVSKHRVFCATEVTGFFSTLMDRLAAADGPNRDELLGDVSAAEGDMPSPQAP